MLNPVTRKVTDESSGGIYQFTFYCDICGSPRQSVTYQSDSEGGEDPNVREIDHRDAYERANREALRWFNRCPVCLRLVCDDCFRVLDEGDKCRECAGGEGIPLSKW
ncbi:MAG: hypothetical protein FWG28_03260 [Clostridiales bacterium]|nr:hypothetical protein [Clostridiales bacterium]